MFVEQPLALPWSANKALTLRILLNEAMFYVVSAPAWIQPLNKYRSYIPPALAKSSFFIKPDLKENRSNIVLTPTLKHLLDGANSHL